ncbi:ankyrin repeat domain-containing protein [Bauldia sp.]|uniref:ankyrin repeat domain-containing protein n=1 Tax=Bauldia sp. TaxID=2575872 RepID=UPI0025BC5C2A|nr:ankyrin repeat domain-containing protein [Bauldia sp.]
MFASVTAFLVSPVAAGPLHDAVDAGDVAQIRQLIEQGEDVNENDPRLGTPLHRAAVGGTREIAELLVAAGADVNLENGRLGTPLQAAAYKRNEPVVAALIAVGADVQAADADGRTALHSAAEGGDAAIVALLIENGADVNARSEPDDHRPGDTPVIAAGQFGHFDIVDLLQAYGARRSVVEPVAGLMASADPDAGKAIFETACIRCHTIAEGAPTRIGPNLWAMLGREKSSVEGFRYSAAGERLIGTWTLAEINAYIAAPMDYVPGGGMRIGGIKDPAERADLIAYLRQRSADPPPLPERP